MRLTSLALLVPLLVAVLAALVLSGDQPDLEIRTTPWRTHLGATQAESPPGELFQCERDGLHRIDVAVTPLFGASPLDLELALREASPSGALLRRARAASFEPFHQGGWILFEFETIADSAGRWYHLELGLAGEAISSPVTAWARVRGQADRWSVWGEESVEGPRIEDTLFSEQPDLRAVAFGFRRLEGRVEFELFDHATGRELRKAFFESEAEILDGWVTVSFERLRESRFRTFGYRLRVPPDALLRGSDGRPSTLAFFGTGRVDPRLGGLTLGDQILKDRDLVFRAWSRAGPSLLLHRLHERLGWRLLPLLLGWLGAGLCLALACMPRRA